MCALTDFQVGEDLIICAEWALLAEVACCILDPSSHWRLWLVWRGASDASGGGPRIALVGLQYGWISDEGLHDEMEGLESLGCVCVEGCTFIEEGL